MLGVERVGGNDVGWGGRTIRRTRRISRRWRTGLREGVRTMWSAIGSECTFNKVDFKPAHSSSGPSMQLLLLRRLRGEPSWRLLQEVEVA